MARYDVVVVGSGFGGAVVCARVAEHLAAIGSNATVLLLEKGHDDSGQLDPRSDGPALNAQGNRFRQTFEPEYLTGVSELFTDPSNAYRPGAPSMNVATGTGLGGGSLVYDGVSLRAPSLVFEQTVDGRRLWPAFYTRAALDPYYAVVERMLQVRQLGWTEADAPHWALCTKRDFVFADACRKLGLAAAPLKLADDNDANEGWWNQGQRFEGRQDLGKNYLRAAAAANAEIRSGVEVDRIGPTDDGYVVHAVDRRGGGAVDVDIECRLLVLAGGAVGSTALLLRSHDEFEGERRLDPFGALGRHLSSNGDYGVTGSVGADYEHVVEGHKGKPMSSFCPSLWAEHQLILIPFYAAPFYLALGQPSTLLRAREPSAVGRGSTGAADGEKDWGLDYKRRLTSFGPRVLTMGCLALDDAEGLIQLRADGRATVSWPGTGPNTERRWSVAVDTMRRLYESLGGEMYLDSYRDVGTVNTAHPLGGCRMSERGDEAGVVDGFGEAFGNADLFVIDGAAIPSALGVNPSLTIAAVAESIVDRLIRGDGTRKLSDRLAG